MPPLHVTRNTPASSLNQSDSQPGTWQRRPVARAAALLLAAGAAGAVAQQAHAQQAFSAAWFANKGVVQNTAATTGYLPNGTPVASLINPTQQQQQANAQLQQSINNLTLLARGIAAQQAAQEAARQAALANGGKVPDGLGEGGLKVDTNSLTQGWINANAPVQSTADGKTTVAIRQTADKAILNWETFNVGQNTIVRFMQDSTWAVLNRVNDPLARPSQIQGQIKGDGTVMIVNRNGVVFSGSSQVDTRNLVAAAANISDAQFRDKGIYSADANTASFTDANGKLLVEAGARITTNTPPSVTDGGGYVLLLGSEVSNAGTVSTERGQTQMAAGDSFIIRKGVASDANTWSTTRGNEISPQLAVGSSAGKVVNDGLIVAKEGDITLAGRDVQQNGVALSTTTVNTRGTIHLLNSAADAEGSVKLGTGAITAIAIDDDGVTTALNSQRDQLISDSSAQDLLRNNAVVGKFDNLSKLSDRRDQSRIEIVSGGNVEFSGDSTTLATGGQIVVSAAKRTFVADAATLDVAGAVGVQLAMESNNIKVNVQGNELRDAPSARDGGKLANSDVWIDTRNLQYVAAGTGGYESERWYAAGGLLEVGGYLGNQGHRIGEWAAQGGTITLGGKEVVTQAGSQINLSGGSLDVASGYLNTTWLKGADGKLYDINRAPTDIEYTGVYRGEEVVHARWGDSATEYFYNPLIAPQRVLQDGYTVGRDAGTLRINAPTAVLEGTLNATAFNGAGQVSARAAGTTDGYKQSQNAAAAAGGLLLGQYGALGRADLFNSDVRIGEVAQVTSGMQAGDALANDRAGTVWLDAAALNAQGLGTLDLGTKGAITIDQALTLADGGKLNMTSASVDIGADITARSGSISATNLFTGQTTVNNTVVLVGANGADTSIVLREGTTLDVRGVQPEQSVGQNAQAYVNGGSVSLQSTHDVTISAGSNIDVSGGAALSLAGKAIGGKGGNVTLAADQTNAVLAGNGVLVLDGTVQGYGAEGTQGGKLKIETGAALVVGATTSDAAAATNTQDSTLYLDAARLQTGFAAYDLNGHAGLTVADGAQINVSVPVYRVTGNGGSVQMERWTPPAYIEDVIARTLTQRQGADLVLRSQRLQQEGGDVRIGTGAVVTVDSGHNITLAGGGLSNIVVDGRLNAWSGKIAIEIDAPEPNLLTTTSTTAHDRSVWIGEHAMLDVAARAATAVDANGRRFSKVADGGSITIGGAIDWDDSGRATTPDVAIVIRPGAVLDASGAAATFDMPNGANAQAVDVASNGGSIVLKSTHSLYLDGTMTARAGGVGAAGGTLGLALETPIFSVSAAVDDAVRTEREFILSQSNTGSGLAADLQFGQSDPAFHYGAARLSADQVTTGGFSNLSLQVNGLLSFEGDVKLSTDQSIRLYAGSYGISDATIDPSRVQLQTSWLRLAGSSTGAKDGEVMYSVNWRNGASVRESTSEFSATADLVEVRDRAGFGGAHGTLRQQNLSNLTIDQRGFETVDITSTGDLRLLGGTAARGLAGATTTELAATGNLTITAAQIYPTTGVDAQIVAGYKEGDTLDIRRYSDATPDVPSSVFGALNLSADIVRQGGVVRAPLGQLRLGKDAVNSTFTTHATLVELLPGSITSVSAAGLTMPYGGTIDGLTYTYNGANAVFNALGTSSVSFYGDTLIGHGGSVLDLSGGGTLTGAGFITGRGGSVDILRTPLVNANPSLAFSKASNAVYAIVPSSSVAYAPVSPDAGAGNPLMGQQITLTQDAGGLKAGTYTLLPSTYALLPGAFRVEIGAQALPGAPVAAAGNGSTVASGYLSVANTSIRASLPNQLVITSGEAVRKLSSYNEMTYDAFAIADAERKGGIRGELAADAHNLVLDYFYTDKHDGVPMLDFKGEARFSRGNDTGFGGSLVVNGQTIEILADGASPNAATKTSLYASDLNAFGASRMILGGSLTLRHGDNLATFTSNTFETVVRSGATLRAAEVFLLSGSNFNEGSVVEQGGAINTIGMGAAAYDSADGVTFASGNASVLGLSNGWINLLTSAGGGGKVSVGECFSVSCTGQASVLAEGTLAVATNRTFTMADDARYGAKNIVLAVSALNMGTNAALAQAGADGHLPAGLAMNQQVLNSLLAGNTGDGVPAVQSLVFNVRDAINMFGEVDFDARSSATGAGSLERLVISSPAIYGYGAAGDTAAIKASEIVWTGSVPTRSSSGASANVTRPAPGAAMADQLGDGTLVLSADRIVLGYGPNTRPLAGESSDRLALGFGGVNLNATESFSSNGVGTLAVYHRQGAYVADAGYQKSGGSLTINAPLVTGVAASSMAMTAGDDIILTGTPSGAGSDALGAEIKLSGRNVTVDTAVALPTGKLTINATGDITLTNAADIDLSGRGVAFYEQTRYSQGGDLVLSSSGGNITQAAGSVIDLHAENNDAGSLQATALGNGAGVVNLAGSILGSASGSYDAGGTIVPFASADITVRGQSISDFAGFNQRLNAGETFGSRRFQTKQGDLVIGDEVKARVVDITVDGGSLTVNGTIDASGAQVGTIRLAAQGDLNINGTLDTHASLLRVDSYGLPIDSVNRAIVDLTTIGGTLNLASSARFDLRAADSEARGTLNLNAPRVGSNDVAVNVAGTPVISGARTIAVNAFRQYDNAPLAGTTDIAGKTSQLITQAYLDGIDLDSQAFINAATTNTSLSSRLAGLGNYHLRPGVEIVSNAATNPSGDLTVMGDIDLSGYRYGAGANRLDSAMRGFGEPGVLVLRAAGDLNIYGSINDGFAPPAATPDDKGWYLTEVTTRNAGSTSFGSDIFLPIDSVVLEAGTFFPKSSTLNYDISVLAAQLPQGTVLPTDITLAGGYTLQAGVVVAANVYRADGSVLVAAGTVPATNIIVDPGSRLGAGTRLSAAADMAAMIWPKGVMLPIDMTTDAAVTLARGAFIPGLARVQLPDDAPVNLRPEVNGVQGKNWALAAMLPTGTSSWSMQLTAGADVGAANRRATVPGAKGSIILSDTHSMSRVEVISGGTGLVWTDLAGWAEPGTPVEQDMLDIGMCDIVPGACVVDPKRISTVWTDAGSEWMYGDGDHSATGTVVDPVWMDFCSIFPDFCTQVTSPVKNFVTASVYSPMFSVVRTGTGDLGLYAARDINMASPFGVYTAGTQSAAILDANGNNRFNLARGTTNGSVLGNVTGDYSAALASYQAWYPEQGGNVTLEAGRNVTGDVWSEGFNFERNQIASAGVGNWLWRQGSGSIGGADAVSTAWWINFGTYVPQFNTIATDLPYLVGFTGFGTLGGGNLSITAGGDAGIVDLRGTATGQSYPRSQAIVAAVGSTGRVTADGSLTLTGGGDLELNVGGSINPNYQVSQFGSGGSNKQLPELTGTLVNLRGATTVDAGAIGMVQPRYRTEPLLSTPGAESDAGEARPIDPFKSSNALAGSGITVMAGDSAVYLDARRDLVLADAGDPGRTWINATTPFVANGVTYAGGGQSWFSLWTANTALNLFAAGGNLTPGADTVSSTTIYGITNASDIVKVYPSILRATAASGSIYYGYSIKSASSAEERNAAGLVLAPSASGALAFLAADSIYGGTYNISMSNADTALPSPFNPAFVGVGANDRVVTSNLSANGSLTGGGRFTDVVSTGSKGTYPLFAFGPDTPLASSLHAGDQSAALFYAVDGDIVGLNTGTVQNYAASTNRSILTWYRAALPARILAGGDIVGSKGLLMHNNVDDISLVQAGRDIIYADFQVAGPGTLEVSAGRNIRQDDKASLVSLGAVVQGDNRPGADIAVMAGMANGVDFNAIATRYLNPDNQADLTLALASQPGKVVKTYNTEMEAWLQERFGYAGKGAEALAYFNALAPEQQRVFLRSVYYSELREGGREFNDPNSLRFSSFLRSRNMIATLFPDNAADGSVIKRAGDITLFGNSGVHTNFGGNVQMMAPGGQIVVGVQGPVPASTAGLITQGQGDIQLFSEQSLLLGLSRVMTTFGGDIFAWSEQGDINAGRGSKTTQVYTPPKRVYDQWGNVTLSPQVPSSGAGIATLSPIPEAAAGDVDLIAPLGTIDAGEAGIRVSGNVNIFAQQVVNSANIQVKGEAKGLPAVAAVNVGALSDASAAASSAAMAAQDVMARDRAAARQNLPSVFTVRVLGFGNEASSDAGTTAPRAGYDSGSAVQVLGQGPLNAVQGNRLTDAERRNLTR